MTKDCVRKSKVEIFMTFCLENNILKPKNLLVLTSVYKAHDWTKNQLSVCTKLLKHDVVIESENGFAKSLFPKSFFSCLFKKNKKPKNKQLYPITFTCTSLQPQLCLGHFLVSEATIWKVLVCSKWVLTVTIVLLASRGKNPSLKKIPILQLQSLPYLFATY